MTRPIDTLSDQISLPCSVIGLSIIYDCDIILAIRICFGTRTSDSLNEGLPIKMTREKFQRK